MNMKCGLSCVCNCKNAKDWALLALRIVLGVIFILHGYDKLWGKIGMENFTGMVDKLGFPAPVLFAYLAALAEFFGGIALLVGIGTTVASALLLVVMLVAMIGVKSFRFPAIDADLSLFAMSLAVLLMGPGRYSLAAMMCKGCEDGGRCCNKDDMKMAPGKK